MVSYRERPDLALGLLEDIDAAHEREYQEKGYPEPHISYSSIAYCLRKAWAKKHHPELAGARETIGDKMPRMLGLALHSLMAKAAKATRSVNVPMDYQVDGIWFVGEADSITTGPDLHAIEDGKSTRKQGCDYSPERDPAYVEQLATYLTLHNLKFANPILTGVMHVWHIIMCYGSKKMNRERQFGPGATSWEIPFTWDDLNKWRAEMVRRAKIVIGPDLPEPNPYEWECEYCPFYVKRGGFCEGPSPSQVKLAGFFPMERQEQWHGETLTEASSEESAEQ